MQKKCIKLCKSNFYRMEFSNTQVEVRILFNGRTVTRTAAKYSPLAHFAWAKKRPMYRQKPQDWIHQVKSLCVDSIIKLSVTVSAA